MNGSLKARVLAVMDSEANELCDARSESHRVSCERPKNHAKSLHPQDWHESRATTTTRLSTNIVEHSTEQQEVIRWRPHIFEIQREDKS